MSRTLPLAIILTLFLTHTFAEEKKLPEGMKVHRVQAGEPDKDGWYEAKSTEGHFTVSLPVPFNDYSAKTKENGKDLTIFGIGTRTQEGIKFSVAEMPRASLNKEFSLKASTEGMNKDGTTVSDEKTFVYDGHPAFGFKISGKKTCGLSRNIDLGATVFMLIVEYPSALEKVALPLAEIFFKSLKLHLK